MNKKIIRNFILAAATIIAASCANSNKAEQDALNAAKEQARLDSLAQVEFQKKMQEAENMLPYLPEEPMFNIETSLGTMKVKLYKKTPKHRENFAKLALSGYYDGMLFHRVIRDFMIQGGDPNSKDTALVAKYGQGGPGYTIPAEFIPEYKHKKGALAAARRGDQANPNKESSGSQFYIVQNEATCAQLDGQYSVFGETVEGLEVIDAIASVATNSRDLPLNPVRIISISIDEASKPVINEPAEEETEE